MATSFEHLVHGAACAALLILAVACAGPEPRVTPADSETPASSDPGRPDDGATSTDSAAADEDTTTQDETTEGAAPKREPTNEALRAEAHRVLDDWHDAAARGDRDRYIAHFAPTAVFMGTDASEHWDLASFTVYVDTYFKPGSGWAYTPSERHVVLGPGKDVAWFDEALDSDGYGALRGTGALSREGDTWRIEHYSMTFTIPNEISREVVDFVKASGL